MPSEYCFGALCFVPLTEEMRSQLSGWRCNGNRNLQHAIANSRSNFQAWSFNRFDIPPPPGSICQNRLDAW
jgi:hypothetical protein